MVDLDMERARKLLNSAKICMNKVTLLEWQD